MQSSFPFFPLSTLFAVGNVASAAETRVNVVTRLSDQSGSPAALWGRVHDPVLEEAEFFRRVYGEPSGPMRGMADLFSAPPARYPGFSQPQKERLECRPVRSDPDFRGPLFDGMKRLWQEGGDEDVRNLIRNRIQEMSDLLTDREFVILEERLLAKKPANLEEVGKIFGRCTATVQLFQRRVIEKVQAWISLRHFLGDQPLSKTPLTRKLDVPVSDLRKLFHGHMPDLAMYVGDLVQMPPEKIHGLYKSGKIIAQQFEDILNVLGLRLGMSVRWAPPWARGDERFDAPVYNLNISCRTSRVLNRLKIFYVGQLVTKSASFLLEQNRIGEGSLREIEKALNHIGLKLGMWISWKVPEGEAPETPHFFD